MRQTPQQPAAPVATNPAATAAPKLIVVPPLQMTLAGRWEYQPAAGVKRGVWRADDEHAHLAEAAFAATKKQVLERDKHTCRFCSLSATKYQEVHHLDDDHHNNKPENLITVCNLCHQVFHLGMCGMRRAGIIAVIPELTQVEVNHIARAHFVAQRIADKNVQDKLTGIYAILRSRSDVLKKTFAIDISSPLVFADTFSKLDDETFANRATLMQDLRVVPTQQAFSPEQLANYGVNNRTTFLPDHWAALTKQLVG